MYDTLNQLTAGKLMSRHVLTIPEGMTLRSAARLLLESQVSGAPIVDDAGRCKGVLSSTDFVRRISTEMAAPAAQRDEFFAEWCTCGGIDKLPEEAVGKLMTKDPVTVEPAIPLAELAQLMVDGHIHRLIVVDEGGRPIGIVSSMDILAAVARAALIHA